MLRYAFCLYLLCFTMLPALAGADPAATTLVPAGEFFMGCSRNDQGCDADEGPAGGVRVHVGDFRIQRYEVSVAEYRRCVAAGACSRPKDHKRNRYCNFDAPGRDDHPLNCVDWHQAQTYCTWLGGRLPYEAEWEKAARAGTRDPYPWGPAPATCAQAVMDDQRTRGSVAGEHDGCGEDRTWPRGSRPPNGYGLYDMHGGVAEWVYNWYAPDAHSRYYAGGRLAAPADGERKTIRGGAWDEQAWALTSSSRWAKPPRGHPSLYGSNGFRCVFAGGKR